VTIFAALKQVFKIYQGRGHLVEDLEFVSGEENPIHTILADNEFQALRQDIEELGVNVHVVTKEEHVPEVERQNRVIKERARAIVQTLPYKTLPKKIRIALIYYVIFWLNNIPKEGQRLSPKEMIMGMQVLDSKALCKLPFGAYVQVHDDSPTTNTMEPRTTGGINLGPSNMQGGHKFYNLTTGEVIIRRKWTELPVPAEVILRLEELSTDDQNDAIENIVMTQEVHNNDKAQDDVNILEHDPIASVNEDVIFDTEDEEEEEKESNEPVVVPEPEKEDEENQMEPVMMEDETQRNEELDTSMSEQTEVTSNTTRGRYNLRPNRAPNYLRRFAFLSVKAGIKRWGEKAREAVKDELRMFIKEKVFKGLRKPTAAQMRKALMIHCFLVEKRDGRIKARAVADGRGQQRYTEEETYSPTVKLESILLNAFIDAFEGRHVVTVDIKGAFLKASVPGDLELIVKMTGEMAQLMCEMDPTLQCDEQGILYLQCDKALYGHTEAARLFYDDLDASIQQKMNFTQNQYDPCVYNKDGKVTIRVHVDDLKISATSKQLLEQTIEQLHSIYGEITVHWGPEHDYLGMVLTYHPGQRKNTMNMQNYIRGCIEEFAEENPDQSVKEVTTPATDHLFRIRAESETSLLSKQKASQFH
jgi:hypothetical protein